MGEQHAMANLPAIAEGVAAEEQILMAEASSVSRNADLQKLRQDKREFIKVSRLLLVSAAARLARSAMEVKVANRRALANSPKFGETFGKIQSTDMPPQFRAIIEDNRMLHEQIRTYKRDLYDTQASNTSHDRQIVRLQAEVKRMHEALQDCSRSPGEVSAQRDTANTIRQQEEELQKLQDRVSVLAHAKETDGRRFRQIAVERQREREELKREVERLKGLVAERDKAFRAQAFALKQANTRAAQLQQQQAELVSREAALLEELSLRATPGETSTADLMQANEQGMSMKKTRRLPSGTDSMRRRLESTMSTGIGMQPVAIPEEDEEVEQEQEAIVKLMLIVLGEEAIKGFHQQVAKEQEAIERGEGPGPDTAATLIQSAWRMRQAQLELQRLRQQQESQAEAAVQQAQAELQSPLPSPGKGPGGGKGSMRRGFSKKSITPQAEMAPKYTRRKSTRPSIGLGRPASPTARSAVTDTSQLKERASISPLTPSNASAGMDSNKGGQTPTRQTSNIKRPDSFHA
ncbi:hypothetical protein ABBQ38_009860 [Trebouxia sp. C0009 RCD-2024]